MSKKKMVLCKLKKLEKLDPDTAFPILKKVSKDPKYFCTKCFRVSNDKEYLCKWDKL